MSNFFNNHALKCPWRDVGIEILCMVSGERCSSRHCAPFFWVLTCHKIDEKPEQEMFGLENDIISVLKEIGTIAAIKRYRELTGEGLRESKEYVDALKMKLNRS